MKGAAAEEGRRMKAIHTTVSPTTASVRRLETVKAFHPPCIKLGGGTPAFINITNKLPSKK